MAIKDIVSGVKTQLSEAAAKVGLSVTVTTDTLDDEGHIEVDGLFIWVIEDEVNTFGVCKWKKEPECRWIPREDEIEYLTRQDMVNVNDVVVIIIHELFNQRMKKYVHN